MVGPLAGIAARALVKKGIKEGIKKTVKKKLKKKVSSQRNVETILRRENPGDARIRGRIKELKQKEEVGLISARERQNALVRMTKSHKALPKKKTRRGTR